MQFDNQYKQVKLKVVYYGPALGGKTSCLQYIHRVTDPTRRTKLYALNTASDRTLFFDLLALDLGRIRGYRLMLQLYTVPGQVQYNATRRAVLAGADGVVFVADSQREQAAANASSLANLADNLRANGLDPDTIPLVLHYNKRDLPDVATRLDLDTALNPRALPAFETVATTGLGVMEGFSAIAESTVLSVADRLGISGQPQAIERLLETVRSALQPYLGGAPGADATVITRPLSGGAALGSEELIAEAVRANMAMTDINVRLDGLTRELEKRTAQLRAINDFGRLMALAREPEEITRALLERLLSETRSTCGTVAMVGGEGELMEVLRQGLAADPLLRTHPEGEPAAAAILAARQPFIARLDEVEPEQINAAPWLEELSGIGLTGVIAVPLIAQDQALGLVSCYGDAARGPFEGGDLEIATVLAATASVALANARAWRSLEQLNRSLEGAVAQRTSELETALARASGLAAQLEERNRDLEAANLRLSGLERFKGELLTRIATQLNPPVTAIQTAARILSRQGDVPPDKAEKFVAVIAQEAARLGELIGSAAQAMVIGGDRERMTAPVVLGDLLRRVLSPLKAEVGQRSLAFHVRVAAGLESVPGDLSEIEAALLALVRNAIDYSPEGAEITLTARPVRRGTAGFVELRVEDRGAGIAESDLPHVTQAFWQAGAPLSNRPRGLGLGLAVARRVAESHGGALELSSQPGQGTTASLLLPATATEPTTVEA